MNNYYPDELIEEIRVSNDIVDVVSEYVKLDRKGKDYFGLCPFHKEKTPSFSVVATKQIFYCFGCGKGGNVFHFIMNTENLDYIEAVKLLAERAKIQLPEGNDDADKEKARLRQEIISINTEAARFFYNKLHSNDHIHALKYIRSRQLSDNTVRKFGLGYSPENWDSLYKHLLEKNFSEKAIIKSGLVLENKNGGYYDRFRNRIMFPIFDIRGNVIAFGGRVMDNSLPKYMNSPETMAYSKGKNLYAMNFAKNSGQKKILIVEGYMDVISLHQSGIINTVASLGTALTESQGRLLKKYAEEIIISYDADTAGQAATIRGLDLLNDIGCNVKVLVIPESKDPDEFVRKKGTAEFVKLIDNAMSLLEYKIKILKNSMDTSSTEGKVAFLNKVADLMVKVDNNLEREMYAKKLSKEYEISEESIFAEIFRRTKPRNNFKGIIGNNIVKETNKDGSSKNKEDKLTHYERVLLSLLCLDNSVYKIIKNKFGVKDFGIEDNIKIAEYVYDKLEKNKGIVPGELLTFVDHDTASSFTKIIQHECNYEDNGKAVLDIIKRIEIHKLEKRKQDILDLLSSKNEKIEGDVEKLNQELMSLILSIKRVKES